MQGSGLVHALYRKKINLAGWAFTIETQRGNEAIKRSLIDVYERWVKEYDEMYETLYKHFAELFRRSGTLIRKELRERNTISNFRPIL